MTLFIVLFLLFCLLVVSFWLVFPQVFIGWSKLTSIKHEPEVDKLLSKEECDKVLQDVLALRPIWNIFPNPFSVKAFYYLGGARYINDIKDHARYREKYENTNPVLKENFEWVYHKLINFYENKLGVPVRLIQDGAYPGFHIFVPDKLTRHPIASLHCDKQFVDWNGKKVDGNFSFTLPITLPEKGAGLFLFDETADEISHYARPLLRFKNKMKLKYEEGHLVTHDGKRYHMIAPSEIHDGEYRLTLQGHGISVDRVWYLFF